MRSGEALASPVHHPHGSSRSAKDVRILPQEKLDGGVACFFFSSPLFADSSLLIFTGFHRHFSDEEKKRQGKYVASRRDLNASVPLCFSLRRRQVIQTYEESRQKSALR